MGSVVLRLTTLLDSISAVFGFNLMEFLKRKKRENKPGAVLFIQTLVVWFLARFLTYRHQMRQGNLQKRPISSMCLPSWQFLASSIWKWWRGEQDKEFLAWPVRSSWLLILLHWCPLDICDVCQKRTEQQWVGDGVRHQPTQGKTRLLFDSVLWTNFKY